MMLYALVATEFTTVHGALQQENVLKNNFVQQFESNEHLSDVRTSRVGGRGSSGTGNKDRKGCWGVMYYLTL